MSEANLVLIGLRGSGKSTLGAAVALGLSREFVDLDVLTLSRLGHTSASDAFASGGEAAFRREEAEGLRDVLRRHGRVVALGGGTPTAPGAADLLSGERAAGRAVVTYLHASPSELRRRLIGTDMANRPGLLGGDPLAEIEEVYARRDGLYRRLANRVVEVGGRSVEAVAAELLRAMEPDA